MKRTKEEIYGVKQLAEMAQKNSIVPKIFNDFGNLLIPGISKFKANCTVIGGRISKSFELFQEAIKT